MHKQLETFFSRKVITFGVLNTLAKAFSCRLTPTANMRKPSPGAYRLGVNQAKETGCNLHSTMVEMGDGVRAKLDSTR